MKLENNYLSDKKLEQLILEIEQNELVQAPPNLLEEVICQIEMISEIDSSGEIVDKTIFENETRQSKVAHFGVRWDFYEGLKLRFINAFYVKFLRNVFSIIHNFTY